MRSRFIVLAFILFAGLGSNTQAGTVSFEGDVGFPSPGQNSGVINVVFDLEPMDNFQNGGVSLGVNLSRTDYVKFTSAQVLNPSSRWTIAAATVSDGSIEFNAFSVVSPALPTGAQDVVFATINYQFVGSPKYTLINFDAGPETLVDGRDFGTDVTGNYVFQPNFFGIPEPSSLTLIGMSLIRLALRRCKT